MNKVYTVLELRTNAAIINLQEALKYEEAVSSDDMEDGEARSHDDNKYPGSCAGHHVENCDYLTSICDNFIGLFHAISTLSDKQEENYSESQDLGQSGQRILDLPVPDNVLEEAGETEQEKPSGHMLWDLPVLDNVLPDNVLEEPGEIKHAEPTGQLFWDQPTSNNLEEKLIFIFTL